jgi:hypothetical protein
MADDDADERVTYQCSGPNRSSSVAELVSAPDRGGGKQWNTWSSLSRRGR